MSDAAEEKKAETKAEETKAEEAKKEAADAEMKDAAEEEKADEADKKKLVPEKPKELEEDAPADGRGKISAGALSFLTEDTTLNVMPIAGGKLLTSLSEGGCQYLLAGARASVGVKAGRYMFEVKIVEKKSPSEAKGNTAQSPHPRQLVRMGVATSDSTLFLPDSGVCFDSEGKYQACGKDPVKKGRTFAQNQVLAVVLNLDPESPNADTISLFSNGTRCCQPEKLPESLKGKALFPVVTFRNVTLQVNFSEPMRPLPFKCRPLSDAAQADCEVKTATPPRDGKYEVIFPVGMPDEGTFAWLDQFLAKNRNYTDLSDRMIINWATTSGIQRRNGFKPSLDKPDMASGLQFMDDFSVRKILKALVPALDRNFVAMEVKKNLLADERKKALYAFPAHSFKRVCQVRMGEPDEAFKAGVLDHILAGKKAKAEKEAQKKRDARDRKKAEELRKKKAEAAKKEREEKAKKAKAAREAKAAGKEVPEEEPVEEKMEEVKEEEPEEEIVAEEVALTDEDRQVRFIKRDSPDIQPAEVSSAFAKFSLPGNDEGFDQIVYVWQAEDKSKDELKQWQLNKKMTERVEDLKPGEWFKGKWDEWKKAVSGWKNGQREFKDPNLKKRAEERKKKAEAEKKKKEAEEKKDGDGEKKDGEEKKDVEEEPAKEDVKMDINVEDLDVFAVADVNDVGNGEPLFAHFAYEDWALLDLRYKLHLLVHSFKRDLDDEDRQTFAENHLGFYYDKYFKQGLNVKDFGLSKLPDLIDLVKDTIEIGDKTMIKTQLSDETPADNFIKLAEEHRRDRSRRAEAGDETAELKFNRQAVNRETQRPAPPSGLKRPAPGRHESAPPAKSTRFPTSTHRGGAPAYRDSRDSRPWQRW